MDNKQLKLMQQLAEKLKSKPKTREEILNSFVSAGILTKSGKYTKAYATLQKIEDAAAKG